jgi:hypothetical protein
MLTRRGLARIDATGAQVIDVSVDGGYRPDVIHARSGLPLRVIFHRRDASECAEKVVFSDPRLERHLALAGTTIVDLPARPAGEVRFTCGMGRYVGRIELTDAPRSLITRLRQRAGQLETPLGTALVPWICSLPLIALLAVFALDAMATLTAAAAALVVWIAGCLWAFSRTARRNGAAPSADNWRLKRS